MSIFDWLKRKQIVREWNKTYGDSKKLSYDEWCDKHCPHGVTKAHEGTLFCKCGAVY